MKKQIGVGFVGVLLGIFAGLSGSTLIPMEGEITPAELKNLGLLQAELKLEAENLHSAVPEELQTQAAEHIQNLRVFRKFLRGVYDYNVNVIPEPGPIFEDLPFDVPAMPEYTIPKKFECDWIITGGVATSNHGLGRVGEGKPNFIAVAYRLSIEAGLDLPISFGIWDNGGKVFPGGQYSQSNDYSLFVPDDQGGYEDIEIELVGLDDSCEVTVGWSKKWGQAKYIGLFNIGLRGEGDSFVIRANEGVGTLIMDGCYFLPGPKFDGTGKKHTSGLHLDNWETFVWTNHQFRGVTPSDPGTLFREHCGYLKSCIGQEPGTGTWIVGNTMNGGNRTNFQVRPERLHDDGTPGNAWPNAPLIIAYNESDGYGFEHGNTPTTADGGSAITVWSNPNFDTFVFGNRITNARYGCLVLSGQKANRNYLNANGYPIKSVYLYDNLFENKNGNRTCASITSVGEVHIYPDNTFQGNGASDLVLGSPWVMQDNSIEPIDNGTISIYGQAAVDEISLLNVDSYDPDNLSKKIPITRAVLESYAVTAAQ
jgi:hypothetical protein